MVWQSNGRDWHKIESESRTRSGFQMVTVLYYWDEQLFCASNIYFLYNFKSNHCNVLRSISHCRKKAPLVDVFHTFFFGKKSFQTFCRGLWTVRVTYSLKSLSHVEPQYSRYGRSWFRMVIFQTQFVSGFRMVGLIFFYHSKSRPDIFITSLDRFVTNKIFFMLLQLLNGLG
jgi:hypothetical protein